MTQRARFLASWAVLSVLAACGNSDGAGEATTGGAGGVLDSTEVPAAATGGRVSDASGGAATGRAGADAMSAVATAGQAAGGAAGGESTSVGGGSTSDPDGLSLGGAAGSESTGEGGGSTSDPGGPSSGGSTAGGEGGTTGTDAPGIAAGGIGGEAGAVHVGAAQAGTAGVPSASGGAPDGGEGGIVDVGGAGAGGATTLEPGLECTVKRTDESNFCIEGAVVNAGDSASLDIVMVLRSGCRRVSQSHMLLRVSSLDLTLAEGEPVVPRQCETAADCEDLFGADATACDVGTVNGVQTSVCFCGGDFCARVTMHPIDCDLFRPLAGDGSEYSWTEFADHSGGCSGMYLYEGVVGRIVVQAAPGTPPGDYTIDVARVNVGGDDFTEQGCEGELARGAIIRVQ